MTVFPHEYLADLMLRLAHNSTAIDGSPLSLSDIRAILTADYIPRAMSVREFYEVANYKQLGDALQKAYAKRVPVDLSFIKNIHVLLGNGMYAEPGRFKIEANFIKGTEITTVPPFLVATALTDCWRKTAKKIKASKGSAEKKTRALCRHHIDFIHIYPFSQGNGQVGRALLLYYCLLKGAVPIIVPADEKDVYFNVLQTEDAEMFTAMVLKWQDAEREIMRTFGIIFDEEQDNKETEATQNAETL